MLFDNPVEKVQAFLEVMTETGALPEFECFDVGIVRSVEMYARTGLYKGHLDYNFVMGVESGMPADPDLLPILARLAVRGLDLAGHGDWPSQCLVAAPARRGAGWQPADRARGYVLSARWQQGDQQRGTDRCDRPRGAERGARDRQPSRSACAARPRLR